MHRLARRGARIGIGVGIGIGRIHCTRVREIRRDSSFRWDVFLV